MMALLLLDPLCLSPIASIATDCAFSGLSPLWCSLINISDIINYHSHYYILHTVSSSICLSLRRNK